MTILVDQNYAAAKRQQFNDAQERLLAAFVQAYGPVRGAKKLSQMTGQPAKTVHGGRRAAQLKLAGG